MTPIGQRSGSSLSKEIDALRAAAVADPDVPEVVRRFLSDGARLERLALDPFGRWTYQGREVEHPRVAALFHRSLERTPAGTWVLEVAPYVYPVIVEGAGRFVRKLRVTDGRWLGATVSGSEIELADAEFVTDGDRFLGVRHAGELYRLIDTAHRDLLAVVDVDAAGRWVADTPNGLVSIAVISAPGERGNGPQDGSVWSSSPS